MTSPNYITCNCLLFPVISLTLVRRWIRHHARQYHINLIRIPVVPTLIHHFRFTGPGHGRWAIKLHGGAKFLQKKYMFFPGIKGSFATFRRLHFHGSFTISFYVKPLRVKGKQTIIGSWAKRRWLYKLLLVNGKLRLWLRRGPRPGLNMVTTPASGKLKPKKWYHIAFTWNARTRYAKIFLNGIQVGAKKSKYPKAVLFPSPGLTALGIKQDSKNENFKGYLAGLRISQGVVPKSRFLIYTRRIKKFKIKLGGFRYVKVLRRNLRQGE
jgi:hypothetical protein